MMDVDRFLAAMGALVTVAGGFALAGLLCAQAVDYCWRKTKEAVLLFHIEKAIREYRERHPNTPLSLYPDEQGDE